MLPRNRVQSPAQQKITLVDRVQRAIDRIAFPQRIVPIVGAVVFLEAEVDAIIAPVAGDRDIEPVIAGEWLTERGTAATVATCCAGESTQVARYRLSLPSCGTVRDESRGLHAAYRVSMLL